MIFHQLIQIVREGGTKVKTYSKKYSNYENINIPVTPHYPSLCRSLNLTVYDYFTDYNKKNLSLKNSDTIDNKSILLSQFIIL